VLYGGIVITIGHFAMAFHGLSFVYGGLLAIILGTGLLKPNMSSMVGALYAPDDPRRDSGFSIFYMGINLGALLARWWWATSGRRSTGISASPPRGSE